MPSDQDCGEDGPAPIGARPPLLELASRCRQWPSASRSLVDGPERVEQRAQLLLRYGEFTPRTAWVALRHQHIGVALHRGASDVEDRTISPVEQALPSPPAFGAGAGVNVGPPHCWACSAGLVNSSARQSTACSKLDGLGDVAVPPAAAKTGIIDTAQISVELLRMATRRFTMCLRFEGAPNGNATRRARWKATPPCHDAKRDNTYPRIGRAGERGVPATPARARQSGRAVLSPVAGVRPANLQAVAVTSQVLVGRTRKTCRTTGVSCCRGA